jgi:hypothetical protein
MTTTLNTSGFLHACSPIYVRIYGLFKVTVLKRTEKLSKRLVSYTAYLQIKVSLSINHNLQGLYRGICHARDLVHSNQKLS